MSTKQQNIIDVVERAVKSFVQGFLATWALSNFAMTKVAGYAALIGGISLVWNITSKIQNSVTTKTQ